MFSAWQLVLVAVLYMLVILFGVAYYADKRAERGRGLVNHPAIYTLSIAVYCTSWTFYGSVGRATQSGLGVSSDLSRPNPGLRVRLVSAAQDRRDRQGPANDLDRGLHRRPLRQEPGRRRPGRADRGGRDHSLHRPAAEGGVDQSPRAGRRSDRHGGQGCPTTRR